MQRIDPPLVRPGQPVTAAIFEQMRRAVHACRLIAGPGVRLVQTPSGTMVSFSGKGSTFLHSWYVTLIGTSAATIRPGTINEVPAAIKGRPLDGGELAEPPVLEFGRPEVDKEGRGWICAEVTCDTSAKGKWAIQKVEIVQVADPDSDGGGGGAPQGEPSKTGGAIPLPGGRARHPLAMLRLRKSGRLDCFQVTCFDLQHRVKFGPDKVTPIRHFFF